MTSSPLVGEDRELRCPSQLGFRPSSAFWYPDADLLLRRTAFWDFLISPASAWSGGGGEEWRMSVLSRTPNPNREHYGRHVAQEVERVGW